MPDLLPHLKNQHQRTADDEQRADNCFYRQCFMIAHYTKEESEPIPADEITSAG